MWRNYFKIAGRRLQHRWPYTILHVVGLAVGIAGGLLIATMLRFELNFNRAYPDAARIFRVNQLNTQQQTRNYGCGPNMAPALAKDLSEVAAALRIHKTPQVVGVLRPDGQSFQYRETAFAYADSTFFTFFPGTWLEGNPQTALRTPQEVVLTASARARLFGDGPALGQTLRIENRLDVQVTGVVADWPAHVSERPGVMAPFELLRQTYRVPKFDSWWWPATFTYVKLHDAQMADRLNAGALLTFIRQYRNEGEVAIAQPELQALTDLRLHGEGEDEGRANLVYVFVFIGAFIVLIACINFINLATAQSAQRAREVGLRKVIGARRAQLIAQFLCESTLITLAALVVGVGLAEVILPFFNQLAGYVLVFDYGSGAFWRTLALLGILVGVLSGAYPAFFLTQFTPIGVLRQQTQRLGGKYLRKGLVVGQFTISIGLIICTLVVFGQLRYMQQKSLGYETERVVALPVLGAQAVLEGYETFRHALDQRLPATRVTAASWVPGEANAYGFPVRMGENTLVPQGILYVDFNFMEVMRMRCRQGRTFSEDVATDRQSAFVLNEQAVRQFDLADPLAQSLTMGYSEYGKVLYQKTGEIIGVAEDFHLYDLRSAIGPVVITVADNPNYLRYFLVRLPPGDLPAQLAALRAQWQAQFPDYPYEPQLLDERLAAAYEADLRLGQTIGLFSGVGILIACLGLLGLSAFATEQRTKEIGIRKVLGASSLSIVGLVARDFFGLVAVAFLLATPLAAWAMHRWLETFAYRQALRPEVFAMSGLLALGVAALTISYQSLRAARRDPVRALRHE